MTSAFFMSPQVVERSRRQAAIDALCAAGVTLPRWSELADPARIPAAVTRDLFIRRATDPPFVLRRARLRKYQMCVGVNEARQHHAPAQVQLLRAPRAPQPLDPPPRPDRRDPVVPHQNRAIAKHFRVPERPAASRNGSSLIGS